MFPAQVVRIFLAKQTRAKFVLIPAGDGSKWRDELATRVGGDVRLPCYLVCEECERS